MVDSFISFVTEYNIHLQNMAQGVNAKYDIDYNLDDLKKIAEPKTAKGKNKGNPDVKFLKAYDFALAVDRVKNQLIKTPQDYYTAYIFEINERFTTNSKVIEDFVGARKLK